MTAAETKLNQIEAELKFMRRHIQTIQTEDYDAIRELDMAIESALNATFELKLDAQTSTTEEVPAGVQYPAAA